MIGDPRTFLVSALFLIPAIAIAIPVHELAHAYAALAQGDSTPRRQGYLRRNWRNWVEPYGVLAAILVRVTWGAPAPVNEYRLRGVAGRLAWALAGPAANLAVAVVFGILLRFLLATYGPPDPTTFVQPPILDLVYVVYAIFFLNLATFAFNLLPIPGLDGWRVLEALFRARNPRFFVDATMRRREIWGIAVIVVFIGTLFAGINLLGLVMSPFYHPASTLIMGGCVGYPGLSPCLP